MLAKLFARQAFAGRQWRGELGSRHIAQFIRSRHAAGAAGDGRTEARGEALDFGDLSAHHLQSRRNQHRSAVLLRLEEKANLPMRGIGDREPVLADGVHRAPQPVRKGQRHGIFGERVPRAIGACEGSCASIAARYFSAVPSRQPDHMPAVPPRRSGATQQRHPQRQRHNGTASQTARAHTYHSSFAETERLPLGRAWRARMRPTSPPAANHRP